MSKYTTELRFICETLAGETESHGFTSVEEIIGKARPKIFDFDYPIFDTEYKPVLEQKIIRHFYTREIGQETLGLFKLYLSQTMNEIMPFYNQLYESAKLEFNPLTDVDYTRSGSDNSSTSESSTNSLNTSENGSSSEQHSENMWELYQETPQNGLEGVRDLSYLTNATKNEGSGNSSASDSNQIASTGNGSLERTDLKSYLEKFSGYRNNNPSKLLKDYRETFLNIDLLIIGELEKLFFQLW